MDKGLRAVTFRALLFICGGELLHFVGGLSLRASFAIAMLLVLAYSFWLHSLKVSAVEGELQTKVSAVGSELQAITEVPERPVFMHEYLNEQAAWKMTDRLDGRTESDIEPEYNPETHDLVVRGIKCLEIGRDYDSGLAVPKNRELAEAWYKRAVPGYESAAEKGDAYAQEYLGDFYSKGLGVSRNKDRAHFWWRESAANGRISAQYKLVQNYYFGKDYYFHEDAERNFAEALFWFRVILASHPHGFAEEKRQATKYGDDAALHLTPQVLVEVQGRVRKWLEDHPTKPQCQG